MLDCEESWVPKNWCFWTVVLEKTLVSPLDCKEIKPSILKTTPGRSLEGLMLRLKLNTLATSCEELTHWKRSWCWEEKGMTEDEMAGWHYQLNGHEFEWTLGVGDGQGGLVCCDSWGHKESDTAERLNWTELKRVLVTIIGKKLFPPSRELCASCNDFLGEDKMSFGCWTWFCWVEMQCRGSKGSILQQSHAQKMGLKKWKTQGLINEGFKESMVWWFPWQGALHLVWNHEVNIFIE